MGKTVHRAAKWMTGYMVRREAGSLERILGMEGSSPTSWTPIFSLSCPWAIAETADVRAKVHPIHAHPHTGDPSAPFRPSSGKEKPFKPFCHWLRWVTAMDSHYDEPYVGGAGSSYKYPPQSATLTTEPLPSLLRRLSYAPKSGSWHVGKCHLHATHSSAGSKSLHLMHLGLCRAWTRRRCCPSNRQSSSPCAALSVSSNSGLKHEMHANPYRNHQLSPSAMCALHVSGWIEYMGYEWASRL